MKTCLYFFDILLTFLDVLLFLLLVSTSEVLYTAELSCIYVCLFVENINGGNSNKVLSL